MGIKIWVLCIGGLYLCGRYIPNRIGRIGGPECYANRQYVHLHMAAMTIEEWTLEHEGIRPLEFNGRYMES